jgi:hypothetical protein
MIPFRKFRILFCFLCFIFIAKEGQSQEVFKRRAVYGELLGSGIFGSINYDFRFIPGNDGLGLRVGFGALPSGIVFPLGINGLLGENRLAFEYGAGISTAIITGPISQNLTFNNGSNRVGFIGFGKAGIRYTPKDNGLFFNLNWNPLLNIEGLTIGWFGLGIGYSWKKVIK